MNKNILRGLAVGAALIILLVVLYRLYAGRAPQTGPSPVTAPAAPSTGTPPPAAPAPKESGPQGPVAAPSMEPAAPAKEAVPGPKGTVAPPGEPKEQFGLLVGRYRQYQDAAKMLARLIKQEIPGFIRRDARKPHRYQVWAGPFASCDEAWAAEKSLRALLKRTPKIQQLPAVIPK